MLIKKEGLGDYLMTREIFQAFDFSFEDCEEPIVIVDHRYHVLYANDLAQNLLQIDEDINISSWFNNESYRIWQRMIINAKRHSYIAEKMTIDTIYHKIEDIKVTGYYSDVYDWILLCFHYSEAPSKIEKHYDIETKYKRVFDQPGTGIVLTDKDGKIIEINEMAESLLNITSKGFIGQYSKILLTLFPKDRNKIQRFFKKLFSSGSAEVTIQVPTKDGIRYVQLMSNYDSLADLHLTILRDETEKNMMIKQIEHQQTLQMIGEMAASIAHEIKNPMTSLKGFTDLMKMTATDENKRYLSVIDSEIMRIENIVNEFLDLSKPGDYEMNVFSIGELVKKTIELMTVLPRRVGQLHEAQREAEAKWGYDALRVIERDELPEWIGSSRYQAALYDPEAGHLDPLKLAHGLANALEAAGGRIFEQTQALEYRTRGEGYSVRTAEGEVRADVLVLACNAYIDRLDPALARRVLPVGSYQVATEPLDSALARSLLPRNSCVIDNQFVPDYFRLTPDHRLLFGGGCTYLGGLPKDVPAATRPHLERVFPQLRGVGIEYGWGGHLDCSMKRTPDIGRTGQRYWLQGFSGHGVLPTLAGARAVADAILGDDRLLGLYQRLNNPGFPGGALLAPPLEAIGKAYYRLRDVI